MAETKWTPGPWEAHAHEDGAFSIEGDIPAGVKFAGEDEERRSWGVICARAQWSHRAEMSRANARLIAAAPDLYAATEDVVSFLVIVQQNHEAAGQDHSAALVAQSIRRARAALAKARGES